MSTVPFEAPEAIDAAFIRGILRDQLVIAAKVAAETDNTVDDQIVATAQNLLEKDLVWGIIVRIIGRNTPAGSEELSGAVMAGFGDDDAPQAIDIASIIMLLEIAIPAVQKLLAWIRDRRKAQPAPVPTV